ncbi:MAG: hypothetical protein DRI36_02220 [Caldiserica bacterium]|nr:MAG: hypothetical protein DRI36_02220 [Caldisericota bacterium]
MYRIFLFGEIGSGKETVAKYLTIKYNFVSIFIDTPIREIAEKYLYFLKQDYRLYRIISKKLKEIHPEVWIFNLKKQIEEFLSTNFSQQGIVIPDVRHQSEYNWLKERGFKSVLIQTKEEIRIKRLLKRDGSIDSLIYQNIEDSINYEKVTPDYIIFNNRKVKDLYQEIDRMIREIKM